MPIPFKAEQAVVRSICSSILEINEIYYEMSGMWLIDSGAEGFFNANLARQMGVLWREHSRGRNGTVLVEQPMKDLAKSPKQKRQIKESEQDARSRFDIAMWSEDENYIILFEGKRGMLPKRILEDIQKMHFASSEDSRVKVGITGAFTYGTDKDSIESVGAAHKFVMRHMNKIQQEASRCGRTHWISAYGPPLEWDSGEWFTPAAALTITYF